MMIFASDLDNTIIHSYKKAFDDEICVEWKDEKKLSYMSKFSYNALQEISKKIEFIPITTRAVEQYKRLKLFKENNFPRFALTSNGGILIENNKVNTNWFNESKKMISESINELNECIDILKEDKNICFEVRFVDEMFVFSKTNNLEESIKNIIKNINLKYSSVFNNGSKIYVIPDILNKGTALLRIKKYLNADYVICAGDSNFDIPMLKVSDNIFIPDIKMKSYFKKCNIEINCFNDEYLRFADFIFNKIIQEYN